MLKKEVCLKCHMERIKKEYAGTPTWSLKQESENIKTLFDQYWNDCLVFRCTAVSKASQGAHIHTYGTAPKSCPYTAEHRS